MILDKLSRPAVKGYSCPVGDYLELDILNFFPLQ
jgi:hypothetical protein